MSDDHNVLSRRDLLGMGLLGATALATLGVQPAIAQVTRPAIKGQYWPFQMGVQSYSLRHFSLDDALEITQRLGVYNWDAFDAHIPQDMNRVHEMLAKLDAHHIKLISWGVKYLDKDEKNIRAAFEFAKAMKVKHMSVDYDPEIGPILDKMVDHYKLNVGIHNHGPGARYSTIATLRNELSKRHHRVGLCLDTGHLMRCGEDPVAAINLFGPRVYALHIKDIKNKADDVPIGQGDLRTVELFKALLKLKFQGVVALEYEANENSPASDMSLCLAGIRDAIEKARNLK